MKYRPEIDGLRAVAVVPVILFHAGFTTFNGGFVGVDVFFVISGYLITSLIIGDLATGTFSLAEFYERRARRILPALFLVMLCAIPFAWQWMLPGQFKDFIQSLIATATFSSNVLFWSETDYFAGPAAAKPLLHTWSLAIEEQFYILFPVLLMILWKFARRAPAILLSILAIVSFATSVWMTYNFPSAAFYLLPFRAWELLIGALCAIHLARETPALSLALRQTLGASGLALIVAAIFLYDPNWPFPGYWAALPAVGTALLILFATSGTLTNRLLCSAALPKIGLISYSAYLWHHPIFAFLRLRMLAEPSHTHYIAAILATFALAYLTWKYVETPFRNRRNPLPFLRNPRQVLIVTTGSIAAVAAFGLLVLASDARSGKLLNSDLGILTMAELEAQLMPNRGLSDLCNGALSLTSPNCRTSDTPEIVVWGDSFAMHIVDAVQAANPDAGILQLTQSVCAPIVGVTSFSPTGPHNLRWAAGCNAFNDDVLRIIRDTPSIKAVLVASPFDALIGETDLLFSDGSVSDNSDRKLAQAFVATLGAITATGKQPIIVSPPPRNGTNLGDCVAKRILFRMDLRACRFVIANLTPVHQKVAALLRSVQPRFPVIWLSDAICPDEICTPYRNGGLIYRDWGHLSHWGSRLIGQTNAEMFRIPGEN